MPKIKEALSAAGLMVLAVVLFLLALDTGITRSLCRTLDNYSAYEQSLMNLNDETCKYWLYR